MEPVAGSCSGEMNSGAIKVGGATLAYRVEGRGMPVMVIGSAIYYPRTFSSRFKASYRIAYSDLRHFAECDESVSADTISLEAYLEDIDRVRDAVGFERFVLVGHSHHGNLALEYAKRHRKRVSHLVLIGTPPCDVSHTIASGQWYWHQHASDARKAALQKNQALLGFDKPTAMKSDDVFVAQYIAEGPKYWYDYTYNARPLWQDVPVCMEALATFRNFFVDYTFSLEIAIPVLSIMGRHDYVVPHILWDSVLPDLNNVTYRLLDNSGHTPQLEEAAVFDRIIRAWLNQQEIDDSG